jgi:SdpC family antimicrobial peptide
MLLLIFSIPFFGCTKKADTRPGLKSNLEKSTVSSDTGDEFTGEELFRGIFMFEGEVASRISYFDEMRNQLEALPANLKEQRIAYTNEITSVVQDLDPNFFGELKTEVESDDLERIDSVMEKGSRLVLAAALNSSLGEQTSAVEQLATEQLDIEKYDFNTTGGINSYLTDVANLMEIDGGPVQPAEPFGVFLAPVVAVAIWDVVAVVNYGAIVNTVGVGVFYAAVYAKVVFWPSRYRTNLLLLQRENIVVSIMENI